MADTSDKSELKKMRRKQQNREAAHKSYWKKKTENEELQKSIDQKEEEQIQLHRHISQAWTLLGNLIVTKKSIVCVPSHRGPQPSASGTGAALRLGAQPSHHHVPPPPYPLAPPVPHDPGTAFPDRFPGPHLQTAAAARGVPATASRMLQDQQHAMNEYGGEFSIQQPELYTAPAGAAFMQFPQQQSVPSSRRGCPNVHDNGHTASLANATGNHEIFATPQPENVLPGFALDSSTEQVDKCERHSQQLGRPIRRLSGATLDHQPINHVDYGSVNFLHTPTVNQGTAFPGRFPGPNLQTAATEGGVRATASRMLQGQQNALNEYSGAFLIQQPELYSTDSLANQGPANFLSTPGRDETSHEPVHSLSIPTATHASPGSENFLSAPLVNDASNRSTNVSQTTTDCSILDLMTLLQSPDLVSGHAVLTEHEGGSVLAAAPFTIQR